MPLTDFELLVSFQNSSGQTKRHVSIS